MQCPTDNGEIIIRCDFTGKAWDQVQPMIEGHQGSVISLEALALAIDKATKKTEAIECTMCLRHIEPPSKAWQPDPLPTEANPIAIICWDCIQQADRSFSKDPDTQWERRIVPDDRWS